MSSTQLAKAANINDIIQEYNEKRENVKLLLENFHNACSDFNMGATIRGTYAETVLQTSTPSDCKVEKNLLMSAWRHVYSICNVDMIASANDKKKFEHLFQNPPEFTKDNALSIFGDFLQDPRHHILKGLAEVFTELDPAYKSHSKVKIGVSGLPKKIIISGFAQFGNTYAKERLMNVINSLAMYQNIERIDYNEMSMIEHIAIRLGQDAILDSDWYLRCKKSKESSNKELSLDSKVFESYDRGITIRAFKNGNCHVIFDKKALNDINKALAEYYGEVLPDAEEENVKPSASTAVSKDLQYYPTPQEVINKMISWINIKEDSKVLEPSCGDGRILDALKEINCTATGIEYHPQRANEARNKGHSVICANFLEEPPQAIYDIVIMNPPFYGKHYVKHVNHALKFLKDGGQLISVLPASARYDHHILKGRWSDLPVGSFSSSGTNIPTCLLFINK